jgi:hypothetical protein
MCFLFEMFAMLFAAAAGPKAPHEPVVIIMD